MSKLDNQINNIKNQIVSNTKKFNFFNGLFKIISYCFIGMSGTISINAFKDFMSSGSILCDVVLNLIKLFLSFGCFYLIANPILEHYKNKNDYLNKELLELNNIKNNEERKSNNYLLNYYSSYNINSSKKMSLTLKK